MISFNDALILKESTEVDSFVVYEKEKEKRIFKIILSFNGRQSIDLIVLKQSLDVEASFSVEEVYGPWMYFMRSIVALLEVELNQRLFLGIDTSDKNAVSTYISNFVKKIIETTLVDFSKDFVENQAEFLLHKTSVSLLFLSKDAELPESFSLFVFFRDSFFSLIKSNDLVLLDRLNKISGYYDVIFYNLQVYRSMKEKSEGINEDKIKKEKDHEEAFNKVRKAIAGFESMSLKDFMAMDESRISQIMLVFTELSTGRAITDFKVID